MLNFFVFFIIGIIVNVILKHDLNILTAFSVAIGLSFGIVFIGKNNKER
jgi:hypothetical protein